MQIEAVVAGWEIVVSYKLCSDNTGEGVEEVFEEAVRVALGAHIDIPVRGGGAKEREGMGE